MLTMNNLSSLIDTNNQILTIKELLNRLNYPMNEVYIDKFWDNIENDYDLYIENNMLAWMGYAEIDINSSKRLYINILSDNFEENIDYKYT